MRRTPVGLRAWQAHVSDGRSEAELGRGWGVLRCLGAPLGCWRAEETSDVVWLEKITHSCMSSSPPPADKDDCWPVRTPVVYKVGRKKQAWHHPLPGVVNVHECAAYISP